MEEILVICEAGPEAVIPVIQRLGTIIKKQFIRIAKIKEYVKVLESLLNQNSLIAVDIFLLTFLSKINQIPTVSVIRMSKSLAVKKVI